MNTRLFVAAGNRIASVILNFSIIFFLLLLVHSSSFFLPHVSHDDYALWHVDDRQCCISHVHSKINFALGRPLGAIGLNLHSMWIHDGSDVFVARLISISMGALIGTIFTSFLMRLGLDRLTSILTCTTVLMVPGWYFYILHLCYFSFWLFPGVLIAAIAYYIHGKNNKIICIPLNKLITPAFLKQITLVATVLSIGSYFYQTAPLYFLVYTVAFILFSNESVKAKSAIVLRDALSVLAAAGTYFITWPLVARPLIMSFNPKLRPYLDPTGAFTIANGNVRLPPLTIETLVGKLEMTSVVILKSLAFFDVTIFPRALLSAAVAFLISVAISCRIHKNIRCPAEASWGIILGPVTILGLGMITWLAVFASPFISTAGGPYRTFVGASAIGAMTAVWAAITLGRITFARWSPKGGIIAGALTMALLSSIPAFKVIYDHSLSTHLEASFLQRQLLIGRAKNEHIRGIHLVRPANSSTHRSFAGRQVLGGEFFHTRTSVPKGTFIATRYALREIGYPIESLSREAATVKDPQNVIFYEDHAACERIYAEIGHLVVNMNEVAVAQRVPGTLPISLRDDEWTVRIAAYRENFERILDHSMTQLSNAFDDADTTFWTADGRVFVWVDFGRPTMVSGVRLKAAGINERPARMAVRASNDGRTWTQLVDVPQEWLISASPGESTTDLAITNSGAARYYVIDITARSTGKFSIGNLRLLDEIEGRRQGYNRSDYVGECE